MLCISLDKAAANKVTKTTTKKTIKPTSAINLNATVAKTPKKVVSTKKAG